MRRSRAANIVWPLYLLCAAEAWIQLQLPVQQVDVDRVCVTWASNCTGRVALRVDDKYVAQCADVAAAGPLSIGLQCAMTNVSEQTFMFPLVLCSPASLHTVHVSPNETHVEVRWADNNLQSTSQVHQWLVRNDTARATYIGSGGVWRDRILWTETTLPSLANMVFDVAYASCPQQLFVVERPVTARALASTPWLYWAQTGATVVCVCAVLWTWVVLAPFCLVVADSLWHVFLATVCWWLVTLLFWHGRNRDKHLFPRPATWLWLQQRLACQCILLLATFLRDLEGLARPGDAA